MAKKNTYQWDKEIHGEDGQEHEEDVYLSRSEKKRQSTALQELGEELSKLSVSRIKKLELPAEVVEAFVELDRITNKEGRRRQLQYIGKLMRTLSISEVQRVRNLL